MPEPKLGSTHDAGISPRKEAARGRGVSPPPHLRVCSRGRQTISFSLSLRGQVPVTGRGDTVASPLSRGCLPPGRQWGRAETSLGTREAHPRPHLLLQLGRRARAPGQRLCFPDSNYVCGSAARAAALHPEDDRRRPGSGRRLGSRAAPTPQQVHGGGSGARVALAHSPGGAQLRGARGALSPGCGAAARGAGAAAAAGGPELSMSVGRLAPVPGLAAAGGLAGAAAGCEPGGASDGGGLAQPPRDLLSAPPPARVLGPASPPPLPSLATGWTRFRAELEDRAPGAALRLLRRRMRRPPPPRPPALWGRPEGPRIQPR